jgi:hypothetical protein
VTTKLTEMTGQGLWDAFATKASTDVRKFAEWLRDGVVAEVRAECEERCTRLSDHGKAWEDRARKAEAALAEARREGAYTALTKLCDDLHGNSRGTCEWVNSGVCSVTRFRDTHYAPTVPASVTLGEWTVTWSDGFFNIGPNRWKRWVGLCSSLGIDPTDEQIAALRALAEARQ